jgi:hypothetical protein
MAAAGWESRGGQRADVLSAILPQMEKQDGIVNAPAAIGTDDARAMNHDRRNDGSQSDTIMTIIDGVGDILELAWHLVSGLIEFLAVF